MHQGIASLCRSLQYLLVGQAEIFKAFWWTFNTLSRRDTIWPIHDINYFSFTLQKYNIVSWNSQPDRNYIHNGMQSVATEQELLHGLHSYMKWEYNCGMTGIANEHTYSTS